MKTFLMHPSDLAKRRKRCTAVREKLLEIPRQCVTACNLCGSAKNVIIGECDRYGLGIRTALCTGCGLVYLMDRFGASGYGRFYGEGLYREISSAFLGTRHSVQQIQANQADYARRLASALNGLFELRPGASLLDVGGSTGVVAVEFQRRYGLRAMVLDPSAEEAAAARTSGVEAVTGSLEDWSRDEKFDVILLCRSIEHFFDLSTALRKIRKLLAPGGVFYCDIADFMELCRLSGPPETVSKIDHCYWLSHDTAPGIFRAAGFEVLSTNLVFGFGQIGFLLQACEPVPLTALEPAWIEQRIRHFLEIEAAWHRYGRTYPDWTDWLRRHAYRAKRRVVNAMRALNTPAAPEERIASAGNR